MRALSVINGADNYELLPISAPFVNILRLLQGLHLGLTPSHTPIRVERSGSVKGIEEGEQERETLFSP
jgi:hypothetical protein